MPNPSQKSPADGGQVTDDKVEKVTLTKAEHEALIKERDTYKTSHEEAERLLGQHSEELGTLRKYRDTHPENVKTPNPEEWFSVDPNTGEKVLNIEKFNEGVDGIVKSKVAAFEGTLQQIQYQQNVILAQSLLEKAKVPEDEQVKVLKYMAENGMKPTVVNCQLAQQAVKGLTPEKLEADIRKKVLAEFEAKGIKLPDSHKSSHSDTVDDKGELVSKFQTGLLESGKRNVLGKG